VFLRYVFLYHSFVFRALFVIKNKIGAPQSILTNLKLIKMKYVALTVLSFVIISCDYKVEKSIDFSSSSNTEIEFYSSEETIEAGYPFSNAVKINDIIILSGVVGNIPGNEFVVEGGIQAETR
jgi:enamine deaminase RidA (YjgF/YER057c/UK114 family)